MSWSPLRDRLQQLPLILSGPILRRTEPGSVTVWLALKAPCPAVTLKVYATQAGQGAVIGQPVLEGRRSTIALGEHLHVVAVTAQPLSDSQLQPGQIYAYDLEFSGPQTLLEALNSQILTPLNISYFEHQLPTFALPPENLADLRLVQGSCRKPHGGGRDALAILDDLIGHVATQPNTRPHQVFLTGDQIYGDDVADPLLELLIDLGDTLLGWSENLPVQWQDLEGCQYQQASELKPGQRSQVAKDCGGFTAMLSQTPEEAKSHLFSLGEYYAMYLLVWSQVLWPQQGFPEGRSVHKEAKCIQQWDKEVRLLQEFAQDVNKVRRALANVPTYMVFDDHDISDDWYLNREWCNRVLGRPLGRRAVQNGLLAYAVFQGWGNTPEQFQAGQPGGELLAAAEDWSASQGTDEVALEAIARYVGLPPQTLPEATPAFELDGDVLVLNRGDRTLNWHYTVRGPQHEVIVLDTRTWRGYAPGADPEAPPVLLSPTAFQRQLHEPLAQTDPHTSDIKATLVVAPTNLVSLQVIDLVQHWDLQRGQVFNNDVGDGWNINKQGFSQLLATLFQHRERVVVLSGDIHYACAVRLSYWSQANSTPTSHVLAQLTSSAFKNAELKTQLIHTKLKSLAPETAQDWAGWHTPPKLTEIVAIDGRVQFLEVQLPNQMPLVRQVRSSQGNGRLMWELAAQSPRFLPDWRYHIHWIKRQRAQSFAAHKMINSAHSTPCAQSGHQKQMREIVSWLWRNRWLQEGEEVVGENNLGVVWFPDAAPDQPQTVVQDVYWRPSWQPQAIVFSRYPVSLALDPPPQPMKVLDLNLFDALSQVGDRHN